MTVCFLLTIQSKAAKNKGFVAGPAEVLVTRVEISLGKLGACAHIHQKTEMEDSSPELQEDGRNLCRGAKVGPDDKGVTGVYAELWRFSE